VRLTISALLERHLAERPGAVAFVEGERAITYAEFDVLQRNAAAWLTANGVRAGDHVAVWLVNRIEWLALLFGLARIGATLVAVNTRYRTAELEYILAQSGARMLVLQLNFRQIDFPAVLAEVDASKLPSLEQVPSSMPANIDRRVFWGSRPLPSLVALPTLSVRTDPVLTHWRSFSRHPVRRKGRSSSCIRSG
jgi:acyl-CoA synthetase (AMP-forming)/AMP-acid ligase II